MSTTTPQQYDAMAGAILGDHPYTSKHKGDSPPEYTVHFPAVPAHTIRDAQNRVHKIAAQAAHDDKYTGTRIASLFKLRYGYIYTTDNQ